MSNKSEATFHGSPVEGSELAFPGLAKLHSPKPTQRDLEAMSAEQLAELQATKIQELNAQGQGSVVPEPETVGDWAGHTPPPPVHSFDELKGDWAEQDAKDEAVFLASVRRSHISEGIAALVEISGQNSRDHGFHDDWPVDVDLIDPGKDRDLQKAVTEKLMLMAEELLESFGEIRDGRAVGEVYFVDKKGLIGPKGAEYPHQVYGEFAKGELIAYTSMKDIKGYVPLLKPEGFLVEIADLFIRGADLVYLLGLREGFVKVLETKDEYNRTRPFKHGRQF